MVAEVPKENGPEGPFSLHCGSVSYAERRRWANPIPAKPIPSNASVAGSGVSVRSGVQVVHRLPVVLSPAVPKYIVAAETPVIEPDTASVNSVVNNSGL